MQYIFDGKAFAGKLEEKIKSRAKRLLKKGLSPKLISIIIGDNPTGLFYANLKKKKAEELGMKVEIIEFPESIELKKLTANVERLNTDIAVHGIMFQLPLPPRFTKPQISQILNSIDPKKDVDGLTKASPYQMPTVKAVLAVLNQSKLYLPLKDVPLKVCVVGHTGFEGGGIYSALTSEEYKKEYEVFGANSQTSDLKAAVKTSDIVISATGVPGLIKKDMVKLGAVLIDVGSPKSDIEKEAFKKASFVSPVPGGVGPITVSCLLENLAEAAERIAFG